MFSRYPQQPRSVRNAIRYAYEALEAGDQDGAAALLAALLERDPIVDTHGRRHFCGRCGFGPAWPGEIDAHFYASHSFEEAAA